MKRRVIFMSVPQSIVGGARYETRGKAPILLLLRVYLHIVAVTQLLSTLETHKLPRGETACLARC